MDQELHREEPGVTASGDSVLTEEERERLKALGYIQ